MYDKRFFASELGQAAIVSIAAMVTFVVIAGIMPAPAAADTIVFGTAMVELA